jgi:DNA invertase Pin-like site-specific DNA recombinase
MEDLERGFLDGLVVYDLDRFARQPVDLERSIRIFDSRKLVFAIVQSGSTTQNADYLESFLGCQASDLLGMD